MKTWPIVEQLLRETAHGKVSRRDLLTRAAGYGLATSAIAPLISALAPERAAGQGTGHEKLTMRFGYTAAATNPVAQGFERFASLVHARSNGEITVKTFCCNQLGNDLELTQSAQSGALEIGDSSNNNLDQFTSSMMVLELPYLIKSRDAYRRFWATSLGDRIRYEFETKLGLRILMVMDAGDWRGIETVSRLVRRPSDLRGLKLRIAQTPIEEATFRLWGANPVPMAYSQVFTALQQKTIDGEVLQPLWYYTDKHYEAAKKICNIHYIMLSHLALINLAYYQKLPKDARALLDKAAKDAEDYEWDIAGKKAEEAWAALKRMPGVDFFTPVGSDLEVWEKTSRPIWNQFAAKIGPDLIKQVEQLG